MQEGEVIVGLLFPADEESAKAIYPRVGSFNNPATGAIARLVFAFGFLLASRFDVRDVVPPLY